ncbi:tautomerase family protein [Burkholderia plantarii]|nr:tautomerase family protein [Burkholderia plantarii]
MKGVNDLLFKVMGKPPHTTLVVIDEVDLDSWGAWVV